MHYSPVQTRYARLALLNQNQLLDLRVQDMEEIKSKSIQDIYRIINANRWPAKWCRIRDVITLRDYIILDFAQMSFDGHPLFASMMSCEDQIYGTLDCALKKYALLSSFEELNAYQRHKRVAIIDETIRRYQIVKFLENT